MTEKTFNASDESQVADRKKKELRGRERELEDLRVVLSTKEGRRFYWKTLCDCGVFKSSFTGNSTTFFNEGKRDIGLKLLADLMEADAKKYLLMTEEAKD
ncbi:Bbp19 family protein [Herminiimonas contaminans]|uniref:Bbp19-like phage domain-containing protein n=1 Tax=Herminiimonas contaminans TaxID=1111140 RepID=A0ABS0EST9_9BURK|nr:hypothetical protein [Herminiimonas contaminans]MBF8177814.1 hypothetical protein [Herminiimonas contaminans]